jgi:hypothetical protein
MNWVPKQAGSAITTTGEDKQVLKRAIDLLIKDGRVSRASLLVFDTYLMTNSGRTRAPKV